MGVRKDRTRVYEQVLREGTEADVLLFVDPDQLVEPVDELVLPPKDVRHTREEWLERRERSRAECCVTSSFSFPPDGRGSLAVGQAFRWR